MMNEVNGVVRIHTVISDLQLEPLYLSVQVQDVDRALCVWLQPCNRQQEMKRCVSRGTRNKDRCTNKRGEPR